MLVVEDDERLRQPLEKFLRLRGFEVWPASTAVDALDAIRLERPAAAIVDLNLPRNCGVDVVASMPPGAPVIMLSGGRCEWQELERLRPRSRIVAKPCSLVILIDLLKEMLASTGLVDRTVRLTPAV